MATSLVPIPFLLLSSLVVLLSCASVHGAQPKVETFTYVNQGEFGPYVTEYGADYRVLQVGNAPFQMAFYNTTPGAFYLALRMGTRRSESLFRWVWEANRGRPVGENATFSLLPNGNLVLAEADGRVVWSTNTANKGVVRFDLLPTGNLVLYDAKGKFVWQSFDYPTDTLLGGQTIRVGGPKLVSRKSSTDGSFGVYSLALENGGITMYVNDFPSKSLAYYNFSDDVLNFADKAVSFGCGSESEENFAWNCYFGNVLLTRPKYNATLSFLRLEIDGNLVAYTYYDPVDWHAWEKTFALFDDNIGRLNGCLLPSRCGAYGLCQDQMCVACPSSDGLRGWSSSCARQSVSSSAPWKARYYKVKGVETFLSTYSKGEGVVKLEECNRRCSADSNCLGFLYWEKESKCWLAPVLDTLASVSEQSHVAYIKY